MTTESNGDLWGARRAGSGAWRAEGVPPAKRDVVVQVIGGVQAQIDIGDTGGHGEGDLQVRVEFEGLWTCVTSFGTVQTVPQQLLVAMSPEGTRIVRSVVESKKDVIPSFSPR